MAVLSMLVGAWIVFIACSNPIAGPANYGTK
jgi:hypothetical protein